MIIQPSVLLSNSRMRVKFLWSSQGKFSIPGRNVNCELGQFWTKETLAYLDAKNMFIFLHVPATKLLDADSRVTWMLTRCMCYVMTTFNNCWIVTFSSNLHGRVCITHDYCRPTYHRHGGNTYSVGSAAVWVCARMTHFKNQTSRSDKRAS